MQYIHDSEDLQPYAGFVHRPEPEGFTTIIAGPPEAYGPEKTGRELNQFPTRRIQLSIHTWPPGKAHGSHHHRYWEQVYYIFSGQARIVVDGEERIVGAGGSAFMPANVDHDIEAVGDEEMVAAVVTCVLDDENAGKED